MKNRIVILSLYTLICSVILYFSFQVIFEFPSHYLYSNSGDGLKNYYTLTHYVKHDNGFHFSGMNYPYGEHIVFTDNQPVYALTLKWISNNIINLDNHIVGILNIWLIFSIFLTGLFLLLVLKFFRLPDWYALVFALLITFLSPQISRISAHFALSYGFYIPAVWYFLLRIYSKNSSLLHYIGLGFIFMVSALTHLYFLPINMLLITMFSIFTLIIKKKEVTRKVIQTTLLSGLISAFTVLLISMTDTIKDRPPKPWGLDTYVASFESIFLPNSGRIHEILEVGNQQTEGIAYVGLIGSLFLIIFAIYLIVKLFKTPFSIKNIFSSNQNKQKSLLNISLFTGIFALFFSTYLIHKIDIFGILNSIEKLNQFRSIGRFAWIFYYIYTVFISYYIYQFFKYYQNKGKSTLAFLTLILVICVWSEEAQMNLTKATKSIFNQNEILTEKDNTYSNILKNAGKNVDDFQAILQVPYIIVGSEHWVIDNGDWTLRQSFKCSNEIGLPIMDFAMSRTSLSQSLDLLQFLNDLPIKKSRLEKMDQRSILLLSDTILIRNEEKSLLNKAHFIGKNENIKLYELPIDSLIISKNKYGKYQSISNNNDTTVIEGTQGFYFVDNFDDIKTDISFNGIGAKKVENEVIFCKEIPIDTQFYKISIWLYIDPISEKQPNIYLDFKNENNSGSQHINLNTSTATKDYWVRMQIFVDSGMEHCLRIEGKGYVDGALICPQNSHILEIKKNQIFYDNCPIPPFTE